VIFVPRFRRRAPCLAFTRKGSAEAAVVDRGPGSAIPATTCRHDSHQGVMSSPDRGTASFAKAPARQEGPPTLFYKLGVKLDFGSGQSDGDRTSLLGKLSLLAEFRLVDSRNVGLGI